MTIVVHCFSMFKYLNELILFCETNSISLSVSNVLPINLKEQTILETTVKLIAPNIKDEPMFAIISNYFITNKDFVCIFKETDYFTHTQKIEEPVLDENGEIVKDKKGIPKTIVKVKHFKSYPNDRVIFTYTG